MKLSPDHFEVAEGRGFFRPVGSVSLDVAVGLVDTAIAHARAEGIKQLMSNALLLTGFESPTLSQRYFLGEKWARTAGGAVRLALVIHSEMIHPEKFGVMVAVNRGMIADVFTSETAAIAWLDSGDAPYIP